MRTAAAFRPQRLLNSRIATATLEYSRQETIFRQGDLSEDVRWIQTGGVALSVSSKGRNVVTATLGPGDFFGEACLAGQTHRTGTATAITPSVILLIARDTMIRLLHQQHAMSDLFISHMLSRHTRIEQDLTDQFIAPSEERLASALLRLAHYGGPRKPAHEIPGISQGSLATMAGMTGSRVKFLLKKFKGLGFIEGDGDGPLRINHSLLRVVLHD